MVGLVLTITILMVHFWYGTFLPYDYEENAMAYHSPWQLTAGDTSFPRGFKCSFITTFFHNLMSIFIRVSICFGTVRWIARLTTVTSAQRAIVRLSTVQYNVRAVDIKGSHAILFCRTPADLERLVFVINCDFLMDWLASNVKLQQIDNYFRLFLIKIS
jgi:hypothetical protein